MFISSSSVVIAVADSVWHRQTHHPVARLTLIFDVLLSLVFFISTTPITIISVATASVICVSPTSSWLTAKMPTAITANIGNNKQGLRLTLQPHWPPSFLEILLQLQQGCFCKVSRLKPPACWSTSSRPSCASTRVSKSRGKCSTQAFMQG